VKEPAGSRNSRLIVSLSPSRRHRAGPERDVDGSKRAISCIVQCHDDGNRKKVSPTNAALAGTRVSFAFAHEAEANSA